MDTPGGSFPPGCSSAYDANAFWISENANTTYSRLVRPADCTAALAPGTASIRAAASVRLLMSGSSASQSSGIALSLRVACDVLAERDLRERVALTSRVSASGRDSARATGNSSRATRP